MSDSFDEPLTHVEETNLRSFVTILTSRSNVEAFKKRASNADTGAWKPAQRVPDHRKESCPKNGLETISGLFVYICYIFLKATLKPVQKACCRDYEKVDCWYWYEARRNSIGVFNGNDSPTFSDFKIFFDAGNPPKKNPDDNLADKGKDIYTTINSHLQNNRWLAALGLLLAYDEGPGQGGRRFPNGGVLDHEEIEREASSLTVQYNGQTCSSDFVVSVLEIYATKVCGAFLERKEPCPHCGEQKVEKKPCLNCGIVGDSWTCPFCGTKTASADIPKHGTTRMYCPSCGIPVVGAGQFVDKLQEALQLPPDKGREKLQALQFEYHAAVGVDVSWGKLNSLVEQLTAAATALDKIANALKGKNLSDAETLLASARLEFPDLNYSQFERKIADLRKEEERRERQKRELAATSAAIQAAVDSGDYSAARRKVDETSRKNLPGFKADEWRQKIKDAEAEAERKRKEREERERREKIDAATRKFDEAILAAKWDEAERLANELARLGERPLDKWRKKIADAKDNRRSTLEDGCRKALADFNGSFPANLQAAEAALDRANAALAALEKEFRSSPIIGSTRNAIAKGQEDVAAKKRENVLNELRSVQSLTATGSADGKPTVAISWKPGSGGTQVAKWQVWRREKGMSGKGVKLGEFAGTETKREDSRSDLKIGVEYEYGVMPMAEIEGTFKPNEKAVVWSAPAVCLVRLPDNALSGTGQGMEGVGGVVTLKWKMPEGVPSGAPHRLFLSRGDGKFSDMDVTDFKELFEDTNVSIDATLEYSLRFELCGRDMGTSKKRISVEKVPPPPSVGKITFGRNAQGSLLAKWDWPAGLDSCIWGVTTDKANSPADIPKISRNPVSKRTYAEKGGVVAKPLDGGGSCWISVFGARTFGDKEFYSAGRCAPLGETKLAYAIDAHPGGLFLKRKPAFLVIKSSTGYFPELDVRASRIRADVLSPRGGRSVLRTESETGMAEKRIPLDGLVPPGEFVGVFLVHPETENCRIDPPSKFEVK